LVEIRTPKRSEGSDLAPAEYPGLKVAHQKWLSLSAVKECPCMAEWQKRRLKEKHFAKEKKGNKCNLRNGNIGGRRNM